jgi:hypothetical protein
MQYGSLATARTNGPNHVQYIHQITELCQRKFPRKADAARRVIYSRIGLTIDGFFARPSRKAEAGLN